MWQEVATVVDRGTGPSTLAATMRVPEAMVTTLLQDGRSVNADTQEIRVL